MSEREKRYQLREKRKGFNMGDREDDHSQAFLKGSKEFHLNMLETMREMIKLLKGLNQHQNEDKPTNERNEEATHVEGSL